MPLTVLITGFGPFPTAPMNPTEALALRLAKLRRPALSDVRLLAHVFATSYRAVDHDLPCLLETHRPDVVLMFGLAARRRHLCIETRARNAISGLLPDAANRFGPRSVVARGGPAALPYAPWSRRLLRPARGARVKARLSHDAGRYVCNYLCWRALEAASRTDGPLVAFIHVPKIRSIPRPARHGMRPPFTLAGLARAGEAILLAVAAEARRPRMRR